MCYIFPKYRYECGCEMPPEAVEDVRVDPCKDALESEWAGTKGPCDWLQTVDHDYVDRKMCHKHEIHWEAYYGCCWAMEMRILKAKAAHIRDQRKAAVIAWAELRAEDAWRNYGYHKNYKLTKDAFEEDLRKADEFLDRMGIRERMGWTQCDKIDLDPSNPDKSFGMTEAAVNQAQDQPALAKEKQNRSRRNSL